MSTEPELGRVLIKATRPCAGHLGRVGLRLPGIFPTPNYFGGSRPAELVQSSK